MLDVELIRQKPEEIKKGIAAKNADPKLVDDFLRLDTEWRSLTKKVDEARAQLNSLSRERKVDEAKIVKQSLKSLEEEQSKLEKERTKTLKIIPNPPLDWVPVAKDASGNVVLREVGPKPDFGFPARDYLELGTKLDLIDTERAGKVSGSRFGYLKNGAALLEFALAQFAMDFLTNEKNIKKVIKENKLSISSAPFTPIVPPVLVKPEAMEAMGYVERGGEEIYFIEKDKLYLVGTSEQSVGPMHMGETFEEKNLPRRYAAFSSCFRREAGSYGKDTKGILRVHQFDKVEMFTICAPENSAAEHTLLLALEEKLMQELKLPYHVLSICSGDLGDPAAAKYDIEAWMPGQLAAHSTSSGQEKGEYRETHSTSNTTDYQARRLNIKLKAKSQNLKPQFVHMLNGTAFAIGRMLIAILENYQTKDGSVMVPKALRKYMPVKKLVASR